MTGKQDRIRFGVFDFDPTTHELRRDSPRFIRTVPKRGYQFIYFHPVRTSALAKPRRKIWGVAGVLLLALLAAGAYWRFRGSAETTVAVTHFDNQTGDRSLDRLADVLTDSVVAELTRSGTGRFSVIGNAAILRQARERRDIAAIGASLKAGYVVLCQVQRNGPGISLLAHLIRLPEQKHVHVARIETTAEDALTKQTDLARRLATEMSSRLPPASH